MVSVYICLAFATSETLTGTGRSAELQLGSSLQCLPIGVKFAVSNLEISGEIYADVAFALKASCAAIMTIMYGKSQLSTSIVMYMFDNV